MMKKNMIQHMGKLLGRMMMVFFLTLAVACSGDKDADVIKNPVLRIYVYAPSNPIHTRANNGDVTATAAEKEIHSLQIWVFEHETGNLVGYLSPVQISVLNTNGQDSYELAVSKDFAARKPSVDVYVLANCSQANCGSRFSANTTRAELDAAQIGNDGANDFFGLTTLRSSVDVNEGLPMSGVLKEQPIYGESPVLRVGTSEKLATVRLVCAVSKVRFVFGRAEDAEKTLNILSISLDDYMIPTAQYLMLDVPYTTGREYRVSPLTGRLDSHYEAGATLASNIGLVDGYETPDKYVYTTGSAQAYEDSIDSGIERGDIKPGGLFYLRESDRRVSGTIRYQLGSDTPSEAQFIMTEAGDFSRNHTWIVYAYYEGAGDKLQIVTVYVKEWDDGNFDYVVYNW